MRLDFDSFTLTGPSTASISEVKISNGAPAQTNSVSASFMSRCLTDTFSITNTGGYNPRYVCTFIEVDLLTKISTFHRPICGENAGQHSKCLAQSWARVQFDV